MKNQDTAIKYLYFLTNVYNKLEENQNIPLSPLVKKHRVDKSILSTMQEIGLIKRTAYKNSWEWISIKPNIKMAEVLINLDSKKSKERKRVARSKTGGRTKGTPNKNTSLKYLEFLDDVYKKCLSGERFSFYDLCKKHRISAAASIEIKKGKLITIDDFGYKWNTIKPNIKMAEELLNRCNNSTYNSEKVKEEVSVEKPLKKVGVGRKTKEVEVREFLEKNPPKNKTISILWGLIKINTNN
jgi:hypothetical protein